MRVCVCVQRGRLRVSEHADLSKDFERWAQFDVHGSHEVVLLQQQQRLAVDLLRAELFCALQTTCSRRDTAPSAKVTETPPPPPELSVILQLQRWRALHTSVLKKTMFAVKKNYNSLIGPQ